MQQRTFSPERPFSDVELARFGRDHPGFAVEREADGSIVMSPTSTGDGAKNFELTGQMHAFVRRAGGKGFDSSVGFTLPDGAVLSPDASWISAERWASLSGEERAGYARLLPEIWIELRSSTDRAAPLRRKLLRVRRQGVAYVALIDPYERAFWSRGTAPEGFALDLEAIYDA